MVNVQTMAKGRNGDDQAWEAAHRALLAGEWGKAREALATLNAFFKAHASDQLMSLRTLKRLGLPMPPARLAEMIDQGVKEWNRAVDVRFGIGS